MVNYICHTERNEPTFSQILPKLTTRDLQDSGVELRRKNTFQNESYGVLVHPKIEHFFEAGAPRICIILRKYQLFIEEIIDIYEE